MKKNIQYMVWGIFFCLLMCVVGDADGVSWFDEDEMSNFANSTVDSDNSLPNRDRKLRILFITDIFPHPSRRYINNQIEGFIQNGHTVYILAQSKGTHTHDSFV